MSHRTFTTCLAVNMLSNYVTVLDNSCHATIQHVNAQWLSIIPIASRGPFTMLLFCSCVCSTDMPDDTLGVLSNKVPLLTPPVLLQGEHNRAYSDPEC